MSFSHLGLLAPLLRTLDDIGYSTPTPIQTEAIPAVLTGKDVMAAAQTGSGKTACFALPLLQRLASSPRVRSNHVKALILTPTRELALQISENIVLYGQAMPLKSTVVYGGVKINPQMMKLRGGVDLLVATPGRLLDLVEKNAVKLNQVETLVLDEADRMLDMGFLAEVRKILALLPTKRQNLLFSATFPDAVRALCQGLLHNPQTIDIDPDMVTADNVKQWIYTVDREQKSALLIHLILSKDWPQALVFTRTKLGADKLVKTLGCNGISAAAIHGDKSQAMRSRTLAAFKTNQIRVLVATDIAARGIDIHNLPHVVNFELPKRSEDYIHRIGRTGRAGQQGEGISLVCADEVKLLASIEAMIQQTLDRKIETGFNPIHKVPLTKQMKPRVKKPKKNKKK